MKINALLVLPSLFLTVVVHPVLGQRTMKTYNCNQVKAYSPSECVVATTSPNKVATGDNIVDLAHNNAIDVYDFFVQQFGWRGMDGKDKTTQTLTHYGDEWAFFSIQHGWFMAFGDGDGWSLGSFPQLDMGRSE
jgi:Zn-dependent metalloprotease